MKKFGRGFVLDFAALMDEVRQPPEGVDNRTPSSATPTSLESSEGTPTACIGDMRSTSSSSGDAGNQSGRSPVDPGSPTEDESPDFGAETIKRMPTRMSVSRTGRCKNRDRQRLTVLQTDHFYAVPSPSDLDKVRAPSPHFFTQSVSHSFSSLCGPRRRSAKMLTIFLLVGLSI